MAPQFDRPLRDLLRAAGCVLVRQGKGSHEIWHSPVTQTKLRRAGRHSEPTHRQCHPSSGRVAQGVLRSVASTFLSSCPALCRASTSCRFGSAKDVDGRDKPGHDDADA